MVSLDTGRAGFGNCQTAWQFIQLSLALYEQATRPARGGSLLKASAGLPHGRPYGPLAKRQVRLSRSLIGSAVWWGKVNRPRASLISTCCGATSSRISRARIVRPGSARPAPIPPTVSRSIHSTRYAWQNLFVRNLFIVPPSCELAGFTAAVHGHDRADVQSRSGATRTRSEVSIAVNFASREVLVAGTSYAGENKKSIFTVLNYLLPYAASCHALFSQRRTDGDTALFFGLSGTGKTTLRAIPERQPDRRRRAWLDRRRVQLEGGCYAKTIRLSVKPNRRSTERPSASARCSRTS